MNEVRGDISGAWSFIEKEMSQHQDDVEAIAGAEANMKLRKDNLTKLQAKIAEAIEQIK